MGNILINEQCSEITQPTIIGSKLTIKSLERDVKDVQSQQQRHQNDVNRVVLVSLLLTLNTFHFLF